jgi:hypothetical protein
MNNTQKTLSFPMSGVSRRRSYRKQVRPYASPWAVNVRGVGPLEKRNRGGSRPGLVKVGATDLGDSITAIIPVMSIDSSGGQHYNLVIIADGSFYQLNGNTITEGVNRLETDDGEPILTEDGEEIFWDSTVSIGNPIGATSAYSAVAKDGRVLLADSSLMEYNPLDGSVYPLDAHKGTTPTGQPLVTLYRDRIILSGANHLWYASRQSDKFDWNYGADMDDLGRAVAGQLSISGENGQTPKALISVNDQALVLACANSLWVLRGDPTSGTLQRVSSEIGIIAPEAYAVSPDGMMVFLSNDGVYVWNVGSSTHPVRFSEERVPELLKNVSPSNIISMAYDPRGKGFHLFITPTSGVNTHWWLDIENKAMWPVLFNEDHQPTAIGRFEGTGLSEVILGCNDGYLRKFDPSATTDDGENIESHVLIGAFRIAPNDIKDSLLAEIHGLIADLPFASFVTWRIVMGDTAESAIDKAVKGIEDAISGNAISDVSSSGMWHGGRNKVYRPRCRGAWCVIWLSSTTVWAYEAVEIQARQLGRLR